MSVCVRSRAAGTHFCWSSHSRGSLERAANPVLVKRALELAGSHSCAHIRTSCNLDAWAHTLTMGGGEDSPRACYFMSQMSVIPGVVLCYSLSVIAALRVFSRLEIWLPSFRVCHRPSLSVWPRFNQSICHPHVWLPLGSILFLSFARLWQPKSAARKSPARNEPPSAAVRVIVASWTTNEAQFLSRGFLVSSLCNISDEKSPLRCTGSTSREHTVLIPIS